MATPAASAGNLRAAPAAAKAPASRIGNEEYHSATLPVAQEAAVLFSAGNTEGATRLLQAEIKDPAGKGNKQAWLMLFDLFQVIPSREQFDSLSMLFTVKFEQSPPAWIDSAELSTDQVSALQAVHRRVYGLGAEWAQHLEGS